MALNPTDIEVLEIAYEASTNLGQQLSSQAVFSKLQGISEDEYYESLEIMERGGYLERAREKAPRPPHFSLTSRGVLQKLEEDGQFRRIQIEVEEAIVDKSVLKISEISSTVNHPPLAVEAIVEMLEGRGDIRVRPAVDGSGEISQVSATIKRRVKDGDY